MPRHRDSADARRREKRRAAHPVQVTAEPGAVRVHVGDDALAWVTITPTEARALAGVLVAVAGDVEARAPADLRAAILLGASDEEREPMREVLRASLPTVDHETGRCVSCGYDVVGLGSPQG